MQIIPRAYEDYRGIPVNALGFAGSLLARNEADMKLLQQLGPLRVLAQVAREIEDQRRGWRRLARIFIHSIQIIRTIRG